MKFALTLCAVCCLGSSYGQNFPTVLWSRGTAKQVSAMAATRDGSELFIVGHDHVVKRIRVADGEVLRTYRIDAIESGIAVSPDKRKFALFSYSFGRLALRVYNSETGVVVASFTPWKDNGSVSRNPIHIEFTPDGSRILASRYYYAGYSGYGYRADYGAFIGDIASSNILFDNDPVLGLGTATDAALTPDGTKFGLSMEGKFRIRTSDNLAETALWEEPFRPRAFSLDNQYVVGVAYNNQDKASLQVRRTSTFELLAEIPTFVGNAGSWQSADFPEAVFLNDGRTVLASFSMSDANRTTEVVALDFLANTELYRYRTTSRTAVTYDGHGEEDEYSSTPPVAFDWFRGTAWQTRRYEGTGSEFLAEWDHATRSFGLALLGPSAPIQKIEFSGDGKYVAVASTNRRVLLYDVVSGAQLGQILVPFGYGFDIKASPDGRYLAVAFGTTNGNYDYTELRLYTFPNGAWVRQYEVLGYPNPTIQWIPWGAKIAVLSKASYQGRLSVVDVNSGEVQILQENAPYGPEFGYSSDGLRLIMLSEQQGSLGIRILNATTGKRLDFIGVGRFQNLFPRTEWGIVGFSRSKYSYPPQIELRRSDNFQVVGALPGHEGGTRAIAITPDGRNLISAGEDKVLKFTRLRDGAVIREYQEEMGSGVNCLAVSPDGRRFAYGREDAVVVVAKNLDWENWTKLTAVTFAAPTVRRGTEASGTVVLESRMPFSTTVQLAAEPTGAVTVPKSVVVPAGATSATFTLTARNVNPVTVRVTGKANGTTSVGSIRVVN